MSGHSRRRLEQLIRSQRRKDAKRFPKISASWRLSENRRQKASFLFSNWSHRDREFSQRDLKKGRYPAARAGVSTRERWKRTANHEWTLTAAAAGEIGWFFWIQAARCRTTATSLFQSGVREELAESPFRCLLLSRRG